MCDCGVERRARGGKGGEQVEQLPKAPLGRVGGVWEQGESVWGRARLGWSVAWRPNALQKPVGHPVPALPTVLAGTRPSGHAESLVGFLPTLFRIWPVAAE